jgi:hypothetical protein
MKRAILLSFVAVASCSTTLQVKTNYTPNTNFAQYRTYAWLPVSEVGVTAQVLRGSTTEQAIKSSVEQQLAAKGIVPTATGNPDFLIAYHVVLQQQLDMSAWAYGVAPSGFEDAQQFTEGTLILDFIDPRTQQAFWRGSAKDVVGSNPQQGNPKVGEAVAKMVQQFPPAAANVAAARPPASQ